jgi:hypothetical protein
MPKSDTERGYNLKTPFLELPFALKDLGDSVCRSERVFKSQILAVTVVEYVERDDVQFTENGLAYMQSEKRSSVRQLTLQQ